MTRKDLLKTSCWKADRLHFICAHKSQTCQRGQFYKRMRPNSMALIIFRICKRVIENYIAVNRNTAA